jgi:hypothetical protein
MSPRKRAQLAALENHMKQCPRCRLPVAAFGAFAPEALVPDVDLALCPVAQSLLRRSGVRVAGQRAAHTR